MPRIPPCLLCLLLPLTFACGATTSPQPPEPPAGLQATPADGAVTLSWEARAGATGYTVYSGPAAAGPLTQSSTSTDAGAATFLRIAGLTNGTAYRFAVSARSADGEGALSAEVTATPLTSAPLSVVSITPADGSTGIARNAPFVVTLNKPVTPASATVSAAGTTCAGALQLSADSFANCLPLAAPELSGGDSVLTVRALAALPGGATLKLRVTSALQDSHGIALAAPILQATGVVIKAALAVVSTEPAAGATGVSRLSPVRVTFNRPPSPASATSNTACTGGFQLSADPAFASGSCLALASVVVTGDSLVATPATALPGAASLLLRLSPALQDEDLVPLDAAFTLASAFVTLPALTVTQTSPTGTGVARNTSVSVVFSLSVQPASVTASTSGTACTGSLQLSKDAFATCVPMRAQPVATDGDTTFTARPAADLDASTPWQLRLTTAVLDATGAPLDAAVTRPAFTTGAQVDTTPPGPVASLAVAARLQAARLTWVNPADADFSAVRVYTRPAGATDWRLALETSDQTALVTGLVPLSTNEFKLTTLDTAQNESAGIAQGGVAGQLTGLAEDFSAAQTVSMRGDVADSGPRLAYTWSDSALFAAVWPQAGGSQALGGATQLWIAVDTDPDADATGSSLFTTQGANTITWPFKADLVVQLSPATGSTGHVILRSSAGDVQDTPAGTGNQLGDLAEVSVTKALLGSPAKARFAFALVDTSTGYTFGLWPSAASATDLFGWTSAGTASHAPGANLWNPDQGLASIASGVVTPASGLVKLSVHRTGLPAGSTLFVGGDRAPLTFSDDPKSGQYWLHDDGKEGDDTAADQIFTGRFNLGGQTGALQFKFRERATGGVSDEPNFTIGKDRVWTLGGGAESAPTVEWGQTWSATHAFSLTFRTVSVGRPSEVRGNQPELGNWGATAGPAPLVASQCATGTPCWDTTVSFPAPATGTRDLLAAPLEFKAWYTTNYEGDPGGVANRTMNDDVLNTRLLQWDAGAVTVSF